MACDFWEFYYFLDTVGNSCGLGWSEVGGLYAKPLRFSPVLQSIQHDVETLLFQR